MHYMNPCEAWFHFLDDKTKNKNKLLFERLGNTLNDKNTKKYESAA